MMKLAQLLGDTPLAAPLSAAWGELAVADLTLDSREVRAGSLFVALRAGPGARILAVAKKHDVPLFARLIAWDFIVRAQETRQAVNEFWVTVTYRRGTPMHIVAGAVEAARYAYAPAIWLYHWNLQEEAATSPPQTASPTD